MFALVDTGTPWMTISKAWTERHGLTLTHAQKTSGVGALEAPIWQAEFRSVDIGGYHQSEGAIGVMDLEGINAAIADRRIDMVIGLPWLLRFVTEIDFDHARIRFRMAGDPPADGHAVPISLSSDKTRLFTSLSVGQRILGPLMLDTGSDGSLSVNSAAVGPYPADWRVTDVMQTGFGGVYISDYARLDGVSWGGIGFDKVPTAIAPQGIKGGGVGDIGLELLGRFNLYLDGPNGQLFLSPRSHVPAAPIVTNTGIQGNMTAQGWEVLHVMRHSPAQSVGLKAGDLICSVDGQRMIADSPIPRGPDGSVMQLALCDGRKMTLTREAFY